MEDLTELSEKRLKELAKMPIIESRIARSKDGKYVIHKTMITDIKPVGYYEKVMENQSVSEEPTEATA
jgi:hypothetical protein